MCLQLPAHFGLVWLKNVSRDKQLQYLKILLLLLLLHIQLLFSFPSANPLGVLLANIISPWVAQTSAQIPNLVSWTRSKVSVLNLGLPCCWLHFTVNYAFCHFASWPTLTHEETSLNNMCKDAKMYYYTTKCWANRDFVEQMTTFITSGFQGVQWFIPFNTNTEAQPHSLSYVYDLPGWPKTTGSNRELRDCSC